MNNSNTDLSQAVDAGWDLDSDPHATAVPSENSSARPGTASVSSAPVSSAPVSAPPEESEDQQLLDAGWEPDTPSNEMPGFAQDPPRSNMPIGQTRERLRAFGKRELRELQRRKRAAAAQKKAERKEARTAERKAARAAEREAAEREAAARKSERAVARTASGNEQSVYEQVLGKGNTGRRRAATTGRDAGTRSAQAKTANPERATRSISRQPATAQAKTRAPMSTSAKTRSGEAKPIAWWVWVVLGVAVLGLLAGLWLRTR